MTKDYQRLPTSNMKTGLNESLEPWLITRDSFQVMNNAHLYRGVLEKISGYAIFASMSYRSTLSMTGSVNGINKVFTIQLAAAPTTVETVIYSVVNAAAGIVERFTDDGTGTLTSNLTGTGTINYVANSPVAAKPAGWVTVTFNTAPENMAAGAPLQQYNSVEIQYDSAPAMVEPIMGIKQYFGIDGTREILIFDTRRVGKIVNLTGAMADLQQANYGVQELPHEQQYANITTFDGTIGPFTGLQTGPIQPNQVVFKIFDAAGVLVSIIKDNGAGTLQTEVATPPWPLQLDTTAMNYINYFNGRWLMTFLTMVPANYTMNFYASFYGDYFTGDFTNFFSVANYQGYAFMTNAVDDPRYYDGMSVKYLNTNVVDIPAAIAPYHISKILHMVIYENRLVLLNMYLDNVPALNRAQWSEIYNPLNFLKNEFLPAPTAEKICAWGKVTISLIVRFSNSGWVLTYTGDPFSPFGWDQTDPIWRCDANFSTINYDKWISTVGRSAIVGSDAVNAKRVDLLIPDFTNNYRLDEQQPFPAIDQGSIGQCYGERFDDMKEGWLCYPSFSNVASSEEILPSDSVLAFNYVDSTYAIYDFPFSVLGYGAITNFDVWENTFTRWKNANFTWDSFFEDFGSICNLGGDQFGKVWELGVGNDITDTTGAVVPCLLNVVTKDFNPYVEEGQLSRFGYVDLLCSSNDDTTVRVQFYKDNEITPDYDTYYLEVAIKLTGIAKSKVWKRIFVNAVAQSHTMRIYQNAADFVGDIENQIVRIHAIDPEFKAAGRIFQ